MSSYRRKKLKGRRTQKQISALQPVNPCHVTAVHHHVKAGRYTLKITEAHGEPRLEQVSGMSCGPWRGNHTGEGFLAGPATCGEKPV